MKIKQVTTKGKQKLWGMLVQCTFKTPIYHFLYRSYWHHILYNKMVIPNTTCYYAARPNPGAGIGHQIANWIAGYWFAKKFELKFAHIPFSKEKWESFLGFGEDEQIYQELIRKGYKKILLPLFDEFNDKEISVIKKVILSYSNKKAIFVAEQDQGYQDQFGIMGDLKKKFFQSKARQYNCLFYSNTTFNIAIHIRRGDIVPKKTIKNHNLKMRWQDSAYFENILSTVIDNITINKPIHIYLFSQGDQKDFSNFNKFNNIHFCLDMEEQVSFLHLVYADLLITSKSSFSYKPALLNNGIKICPMFFWHGYPKAKDWILADENGHIDITLLNKYNIK